MRTLSRLAAALLAIALLAAGIITVIEVVAAAFGAGPVLLPHDTWARDGRTAHWDDTGVRLFLLGVGAVGVALLLMTLGRRRAASVVLADRPGVDAAEVRRSSLEHNLADSARSVDGVRAASVRVERQRIRVSATTDRRDAAGVGDAVERAVDGRVAQIGLRSAPPVRVATRNREH
jgi:hypothetical protein